MTYTITLNENFRHRRGMLTPGIYRVPVDVSETLAARLIAEGFATRDEPPPPPPAAAKPPAEPEAPPQAENPAARPAKTRRPPRREDAAAPALQTIAPRWPACVVAAPGPSLTPEVAQACRGWPSIAVNDAWRLLPWAEVLYACDAAWWKAHQGCPSFAGEKWSSHSTGPENRRVADDKRQAAARWGLRLVAGRSGDGFSLDPHFVNYGSNSGFQAVNLAILMGAKRIAMIGFDMRPGHFFGEHPPPLRNTPDYGGFLAAFAAAAKRLPPEIGIVNATPGSAMTCFPMAPLDQALAFLRGETQDHARAA